MAPAQRSACKSTKSKKSKLVDNSYIGPEKIAHYLKYGQELASTDNWREVMGIMIQDMLPTEIQNVVFKYLVQTVLPSAMHFDEERGEKHRGETFTIPARVPGTSTMQAVTHLLLGGLCELRASSTGKRTLTSSTANTMLVFSNQIREAVLNTITIVHDASFATAAKPTLLPYPAHLQPNMSLIHRLSITIKLGDEHRNDRDFYPIILFSAQDGIPNISTHLPNLKYFAIRIVEHRDRHHFGFRPRYLNRASRRGDRLTSLEAEMGRIVAAIREVKGKAQERVVNYHVHNENSNGYGATIDEQVDLRGEGAGEAVKEIMDKEMVEFRV